MRYYKKCKTCDGQGELAKRGSNSHLSISCTCQGGFVDCTSEVEAMRDYLMELERNLNKASREAQNQGYAAEAVLGVGIHFTAEDIQRLKSLLESK